MKASRGIDDLVGLVLEQLQEPADMVAHSIGGLVALKAVLRAPQRVRRLVLSGTSGGLPVKALGISDWRTSYREEFPDAAAWIMDVQEDPSDHLHSVEARTLLIWSDRDKISPLTAGEHLRNALPNATLSVVHGGQHNFPLTHSQEVGSLIEQHLS
jgi:pimeloyl-ACP methyl ester carboxylesterase